MEVSSPFFPSTRLARPLMPCAHSQLQAQNWSALKPVHFVPALHYFSHIPVIFLVYFWHTLNTNQKVKGWLEEAGQARLSLEECFPFGDQSSVQSMKVSRLLKRSLQPAVSNYIGHKPESSAPNMFIPSVTKSWAGLKNCCYQTPYLDTTGFFALVVVHLYPL